MKIYSDVLTTSDVFNVAHMPPQTTAERITVTPEIRESLNPRLRKQMWIVGLRGFGERHRHWPNGGTRGTGADTSRYHAATWDDWGEWLANLFDIDPAAICGQYRGRQDFIEKTNGKYYMLEMEIA